MTKSDRYAACPHGMARFIVFQARASQHIGNDDLTGNVGSLQRRELGRTAAFLHHPFLLLNSCASEGSRSSSSDGS